MLILEQISKTFNPGTVNTVEVFANLNLRVKPGSFVTIIGGNGAGKSSLLNLISGQFIADHGKIYLNHQDISQQAEYQRSLQISRVFQNPLLGTAPALTVAENLALALRKGSRLSLRTAIKHKELQQFRQLLAPLQLGLEDKLEIPVQFLSGGQRQALTLLMAVMVTPKLLLLDEHTAALDPKTAEKVMELTCELVGNQRLTTLMVTHNLEQAIQYGDRLIMLHHGEIILDFSGEEKKRLSVTKLLTCFSEVSKGIMEDRLLFA